MTALWTLLIYVLLHGYEHKPIQPVSHSGEHLVENLPLVCNLQVSASASPMTLCSPGQSVNLSAFVLGGNVTQVNWTPTDGVVNPNSLNTQAFVNQTTTYQVTVQGTDNQNLIVNGNFNSGNVGFTSQYAYATDLFPEGLYWVGNNPMSVHPNFSPCSDHTGGGNMMVVNGTGTPNQNIWCQTINVNTNTTYNFSAWITSVVASSPAQLQFSFNGVAVGGIFSPSPPNCNWQQFNQNWSSGSNTSVTICIVNQNTALSGNDFAIDDLFLAEVCTAIDFVTVTVVNLNANWNQPPNMCVSSLPINLNTLLAPGATPGGTWTIDGFPTNIFDPAMWGPGAHSVTYSLSQPPCTAQQSHFIVVEPLPNANWAPPPTLCLTSPAFNPNTMLLPGAQTGGAWTVDGTPSTSINPVVLGVGPHIVTYTVGTFPCVNTFTQAIEIDPLPDASWTPPGPLCTNASSFNLNTLLNPGAQTGGAWRINGNSATVFNPATLGPGNHNVSYTVGSPPCSATQAQTITVLAPPATPVPACGQITGSSVQVTWAAIPGAASYQLVINGNPPITVTGTSYTVNGLAPGQTVTFQVQSQSAAGCMSAQSVVTSCTTPQCMAPMVTIAPVSAICLGADADTLQLSATVSDTTGMGIWSGTGIIDTLEGLFDPATAGPGTHIISYTYQVADCTGQDTVAVVVYASPIAGFTGDTLVCVGDTAHFEFTGAITDTMAAVFNWSFGSGVVQSGTGIGPYQVVWNTAGTKQVRLFVNEHGCISDTIIHPIVVNAPLIPPNINCQTTSSSITFYWDDNSSVADYQVSVLSGPMGTMDSDTSYVLTGLSPGTSATIRLTALSGGPCPDVTIDRTCIAEDCPDVQISFTVPSLICLSANTPNTQLQVTVTGGAGNGTGTWSGPGIINAATGLFSPQSANTGANVITYSYVENNCSYSDNVIIDVFPKPTSTFIAQDTICLTDTVQITYTGSASFDATYQWNLADGIIQSGSGQGPLFVSFPSPGVRLLRLRVQENGCLSDFTLQGIQVDAPVAVPVLDCDPALSDIDFYWNTVENAQAYIVIVLQGPFGTITSDTSFNINNLQPGQEVSIQLSTISENACPGNVQTLDCAIMSCDSIQLQIPPVADYCLNPINDPIAIPYILMTGSQPGIISWDGPGIFDSTMAMFSPGLAGPGQHTVVATYIEGFCLARDSVTINVYTPPTAEFQLAAEICKDDTTTITYTGTAGPNAVFFWNFGGGVVMSGSGAGPYEISWPNSGPATVSLTVEENGCSSGPVTHAIDVITPVQPPDINCNPSLTEVLFTWQPVAGADTYDVTVLAGPAGTMTSDTSYLFTGLQPGETVSISVTVQGNLSCPSAKADATCTAGLCPPVNIDITPVAPICFDPADSPITLQATATGGPGGGVFTWAGSGVINAATGQWQPNAGMIGQNNVIAVTYTEGVCVYEDSFSIVVNAIPTADFSYTDAICQTANDTLVFTGTAGPGATYLWDFDGGLATPGTGPGPQIVHWTASGDYIIDLTVQENGCTSAVATHDIHVDAPLTAPVLSCSSTLSTITVSWPAVAGASGYQISVPPGITYTQPTATSIEITGLDPNTAVDITVTAIDSGVCGDVASTTTCTTQPCNALGISWSAVSPICIGTPTQIQWQTTGGEPLDVTVSFGTGTQSFTGVTSGQTSTFNLNTTTTFSITQASAPNLPGCAVNLPENLTITVNQPLSPGVALAAPEICSGVDTLFSLRDLLVGEATGGVWQDISQPPVGSGAFNAAIGSFQTGLQGASLYQFRYSLDAPAPCPDSSIVVSVQINPTPVADAGADQELNCQVNTVSLGSNNSSQWPGLQYSWQAQGGTSVSDPNALFTDVTQADQFTLTVSDPATGCSDSDVARVTATNTLLIPHVTITPLTCFATNDGSLTIDSITGGSLPYQYSLNNGPFVNQSFFGGLAPGNYNLHIMDAGGCEAELNLNLTQPNQLLVELQVNATAGENVIFLGDSVLLHALVNIEPELIDTVMWHPMSPADCPNCLSWLVSPESATQYGVVVIDKNGCQASDQLTVFVRKERDVYIPNGFSPNNDGLNDVFMIFAGKEVLNIRSFLIFNRWGENLFEAYNFRPNDPDYGWNGWFRGQPLNPAVFVYYAEVEFIDGEVILYKGDVTLFR